MGYPVIINNDMAAMAAGAKSVLFGDLSKYIIRDVLGVTLLRLEERYADFHQVAFLAFARMDGDLARRRHPSRQVLRQRGHLAMAQELVRVRMLRTIDQCPVVLELLRDEVYHLPAENAQHLIDAGACERVLETPTTPRLEAAALARRPAPRIGASPMAETPTLPAPSDPTRPPEKSDAERKRTPKS